MNKEKNSAGAFGSVVAAICIVIYVFAVVQAVVRVYFSIEQRRTTAEQEFSNIVIQASTAGMQGFMDEQFIEAMKKALAANRSIEALIISGPGGEEAIERQQGYAVERTNNSLRFRNKFSLSKENYYRPLQIQDIRNANIRAAAGAFDFDEISKILKETLLIILIGFAVAFFTMLLQMLLGKPDEKPAAVRQPAHDQHTADNAVNKTPEQPRKQFVQEQFEQKQPVIKEAEVSHNSTLDESIPKGLYSPRSNIGWEEYIKDRLDSEIHRCASTEKDLTLVIMEFTDITNDIMYKLAAEEAVSFFSSRDLLFEYGKSGILVILPGFNLDTGISKSEKFYQRIDKKFPVRKKIRSSLCIGLSSRSGRLVNGDRLIMEAQEALEKAKHDQKSSIIAFKSDPEKYRAFIASHNSTRL